MPPTPAKHISESDIPGLYSSDRVTLDVPVLGDGNRPAPVKYMSTPAYHSPLRHHKRAASSTRHVKETLNARSEYSNSEDDGTAQHRINQYLIKQEIGRGSFGAVHLAVDQYGQEYAVKEFSKSRLRKRAQSNLLRRPSARRRQKAAIAAGLSGFNSPLHRHSSHEENNSLDLIKEEIAIMKKLNHPNLVSLIEVLDDPEEDSLYMVMEMCKKGVVMQVGLEERADPYDVEQCRCWFRDMILGIEYLHAQGIIHRDLKPDNCLVTDDDVLKIVDFGVSEMFDKQGEMKTAKSAGSPAFMPPELCVPKHGQVSGKAVDIWSMGVTLYCLLFGRIPFEKHGMIELYQSIRMDDVEFDDPHVGEDLKDLLMRLLEKDPDKRITMTELREHPWVTMQGTDLLLPTSENVAVLVEPPTDEEVDAAITGNMGHLVTVVRAVKRFKQLLFRRRPERMETILGNASRMTQPPLPIRPSGLRKSKSQDTDDRRPVETALTTEGIHHEIKIDDNDKRIPQGIDEMASVRPSFQPELARPPSEPEGAAVSSPVAPQPITIPDAKVIHESMSYRPPRTDPVAIPVPGASPISAPHTPTIGKGHAHNPLEDHLFLNIGAGEDHEPADDGCVVSESPSNVDMNVYETAYQEEIQRIRAREEALGLKDSAPSPIDGARPDGVRLRPRRPTLYLTRRVDHIKDLRSQDLIIDGGRTRDELKTSIKHIVKKSQQSLDTRLESQQQQGKEDLLSKGWRNARQFKDLVDEAREIIREEERRDGKRWDTAEDTAPQRRSRSRSSTPTPKGGSFSSVGREVRGSRSGTPALKEETGGT